MRTQLTALVTLALLLVLGLTPSLAVEDISMQRLKAVHQAYGGKLVRFEGHFYEAKSRGKYGPNVSKEFAQLVFVDRASGRVKRRHRDAAISYGGAIFFDYVYVPVIKTYFLDKVKFLNKLRITAEVIGSYNKQPVLKAIRVEREWPKLDLDLRLKDRK